MSAMCFPLVFKSIALETGNTLSSIYYSLTYSQYNNSTLSWIIIMMIRCRCTSSRWSHDEACWHEAVIWRSRKGRNSSPTSFDSVLVFFQCLSQAASAVWLWSGSGFHIKLLSLWGTRTQRIYQVTSAHRGSSETCLAKLHNYLF